MTITELIALVTEWSEPQTWHRLIVPILEFERVFIHFQAALEEHPYFCREDVTAEQLLAQDGICGLNAEVNGVRDKVHGIFNAGLPVIKDGLRQHAPHLLNMLPANQPLDIRGEDVPSLAASMLAIEGELRAMVSKPAASGGSAPATRRDIDWWCEKLAEYESEWTDDSALTPTAFARKNGLNPDTTRKMFKKARDELDRRNRALRAKREQRE